MLKVLAVVALVAVAQILPSCGERGDQESGAASQPQVIGWVDEKYTRMAETSPYLIVINQVEYGVPFEFWRTVDVGDLVKYQDGRWSIVRRRAR
ncbi:MAG: hypothetical protein QN183_04750 [Armatimonadota bacterium]|nr:hypothetical protein [Armatimonadota bacterium]MDR7532438.1 hypothetical protein [Armatimonadota bacterium]MDR7535661.1 hypothetical protein [Armatimonadota bacterium]